MLSLQVVSVASQNIDQEVHAWCQESVGKWKWWLSFPKMCGLGLLQAAWHSVLLSCSVRILGCVSYSPCKLGRGVDIAEMKWENPLPSRDLMATGVCTFLLPRLGSFHSVILAHMCWEGRMPRKLQFISHPNVCQKSPWSCWRYSVAYTLLALQ